MNDLYSLFRKRLFTVPSAEGLFNQYNSRDRRVDRENAPEIRRKNLKAYVHSFPDRPSIMLLCEAPGPWGCRFTGIPITSENQLLSGKLPFSGTQSSLGRPLLTIRKRPPFTEYSAEIFWETLAGYHPRFFVWNAVPLHPYKSGNILSIRTPAKREIRMFMHLLEDICGCLSPDHCIAVGRKAEFAFSTAGIKAQYVRHPSQGGANIFRERMRKLFRDADISRRTAGALPEYR